MNAISAIQIAWQLVGLVSVEVVLLIVIAGFAERVIKRAWLQRIVWQSCIFALLALFCLEVTGIARPLGDRCLSYFTSSGTIKAARLPVASPGLNRQIKPTAAQ